MKIAYLILSTTSSHFVKKLINSLDNGKNKFYLHVNKDEKIEPFLVSIGNLDCVTLISKRVSTRWGGFSVLNAMLNLLNEAYSSFENFDSFFFLTESDYPFFSNSDIEEFLKNQSIAHIGVYNISRSNDKHQVHKIEKYHFLDLEIKDKTILKFCIRVLRIFMSCCYYLGIKKNKHYVDKNGKTRDIFLGTDFGVFSRKQVEFILNEKILSPNLFEYLRNAYVPSEIFFPTILMNSGLFFDDIIEYSISDLSEISQTHYFRLEKIKGKSRIKYLNEDDIDDLIVSNKIFFRKANLEKSVYLLKIIDDKRQEE